MGIIRHVATFNGWQAPGSVDINLDNFNLNSLSTASLLNDNTIATEQLAFNEFNYGYAGLQLASSGTPDAKGNYSAKLSQLHFNDKANFNGGNYILEADYKLLQNQTDSDGYEYKTYKKTTNHRTGDFNYKSTETINTAYQGNRFSTSTDYSYSDGSEYFHEHQFIKISDEPACKTCC